MPGQLGNWRRRPNSDSRAGQRADGGGGHCSGSSHSLAVKADGTVWAWGANDSGQLGISTVYHWSPTPIRVSDLCGVVSVAAGSSYSLAVKADGTVWAWGANESGQLGNGTQTGGRTPVSVSGLSGVVSVAAGWLLSIALKQDGTVWAWGEWGGGGSLFPIMASGLSGITAIAAGYRYTIALRSDGTVWTWDGLAVQVPSVSSVACVAAGRACDGFILLSGTGWVASRISRPLRSESPVGVKQVAGGIDFSFVLLDDGTAWSWGSNDSGQLGDGTLTENDSPRQVNGLVGVTAIAAGEHHSIALKDDGTVWTWGANKYGQLGDGSWLNRTDFRCRSVV